METIVIFTNKEIMDLAGGADVRDHKNNVRYMNEARYLEYKEERKSELLGRKAEV